MALVPLREPPFTTRPHCNDLTALMRATIGPSDEDIQWMQTGVVIPKAYVPRKKNRKKPIYKMLRHIANKLRGEAMSEASMDKTPLRKRRVRRPKYLHNHKPTAYGAGILPTADYTARREKSFDPSTMPILKSTTNNYKVIERRFRKRHANKNAAFYTKLFCGPMPSDLTSVNMGVAVPTSVSIVS